MLNRSNVAVTYPAWVLPWAAATVAATVGEAGACSVLSRLASGGLEACPSAGFASDGLDAALDTDAEGEGAAVGGFGVGAEVDGVAPGEAAGGEVAISKLCAGAGARLGRK